MQRCTGSSDDNLSNDFICVRKHLNTIEMFLKCICIVLIQATRPIRKKAKKSTSRQMDRQTDRQKQTTSTNYNLKKKKKPTKKTAKKNKSYVENTQYKTHNKRLHRHYNYRPTTNIYEEYNSVNLSTMHCSR